MTIRALAPVVTALTVTLAAATASATPYTSVFFFGDSLTDDGNLFEATGGTTPPPPYNARFTNDKTWAEIFARDFAVSENYAFGGAQASNNFPSAGQDPNVDMTVDFIPDLDVQLGLFTGVIPGAAVGITQPKTIADAGTDPLAILWFGANDVFNVFDDPTLTAAQSAALMSQAAQDVSNAALALAAAGADVVVLNTPDLGVTPSYQLNLGGVLAPTATALAQQFNAELATGLATVESVTGATITQVDMFSLLRDLSANPGDYGVTNATEPCLWAGELADDRPATTSPFCGPAVNSYAFFDGVHPTAPIHQRIAGVVQGAVGLPITAVPLPAPIFMLGAALLGLAGLRRAKR
ncbi:MAG: SGNH/GDSL hydrolase family protein [Pseudomonadota bacterium]